MTLHEAAQETNHVSLLHSFAYTHWDAHKIQGCICDLGFMERNIFNVLNTKST